MMGHAKNGIAGLGGWEILSPETADGHECGATTIPDFSIAVPGVNGPIFGDSADFLDECGFIQKLWQNGTVALWAGSTFYSADIIGGGLQSQIEFTMSALVL